MPAFAVSAHPLIESAQRLRDAVNELSFAPPVSHVYNPLDYAWAAHEAYLRRYGQGRKRVLFLGMNPGPFGMAQVGVPFGEIAAVRDWLEIETPIGKPPREHPKRPVTGFACEISEKSGQRLWGLFADRFGKAHSFFENHFVANYCPLAFLAAGGGNFTPDKLPVAQQEKLFAACDANLRAAVETLKPEWLIGVGNFAEERARLVFDGTPLRIGKILHPSPASPLANRAPGWASRATTQLQQLGVWD
jgi:single-strand selective monofunctional uracil DNA glycosylase